eukprot:Phypoly_transcript_00730.p1 GENE.Phypoly_transcript_00730~~Phypoly_transcript_00730.p1  ORF type:complete len:1297 (+),score=288.50 Phypoly_transcript_00730:39-3893(+)
MAEGWLPRKATTSTVQKQPPQVHKPVPPRPAPQPQYAKDDFTEQEESSSTLPSQLPSLGDRLRQLRTPWDNGSYSRNKTNNDVDIEDDDPPLTTRSLRKNKASDKGRAKDEPPSKRAKTDHGADDIEMYNEAESHTDSGAIIKSFFGSLRNSEMAKRKQNTNNNNTRTRDEDSDEREDDIEQAEKESDEIDKRDTSFLKGLVSSLKVLPFYENRDPISMREFPKSAARRLLFIPCETKNDKVAVKKHELKEEIEEDPEDDISTPKQRRHFLMRNSAPSSQASDQSQRMNYKNFKSNNHNNNNNNNNNNHNNNHTNLYSNFNHDNNNNNNSVNNNVNTHNVIVNSQEDYFLRRRDDIGSSQHEGGNLTNNFKAMIRGGEEVEDIAEEEGGSSTPTPRVKTELPDEEIQERNTTSWLDGERASIRTKILYSSPTHTSTASPRNKWVDNFTSSTQATQPIGGSTSSPKFIRNGLTEKLVRVMRQHFVQNQHLYQQQPSSTQQSQPDKLQVIILHDLSKIQPHVNVVLSILKSHEDVALSDARVRAGEDADAETDVSRDDYEFLRTREPVVTVFSVAAAEEMKLGLGSVVTLEHWQEIRLPGIDRRIFLSLKAHCSGAVNIDPSDPVFSSFVSHLRRQNQSSLAVYQTITSPPASPSSSPAGNSTIRIAPVYPLIALHADSQQQDSSPDSPLPQAPPPKPKVTTLDKLHPLSQNFTIEGVVQRCFFREFSTCNNSDKPTNNSSKNTNMQSTNNSSKTTNTQSTNNSPKNTNAQSTNNSHKNANTQPASKALVVANKGMMNLCEIMKQRMTLSQRSSHASAASPVQESAFPIRNCSVILQDDSGATAELLVPDEYASQWKGLFIEGEGLRFVLENLQVVKKEILSGDSPLNSLLSPLRSHSHVVLTVVKNSTFSRVWDADDITVDTNGDVIDTPHVGYCPEPLVDVKTLLDATQNIGPRVSIMGKIVHIDQHNQNGSLMNTTVCTLSIFDGSVDSSFGVNNIGVFVRGVPLTSLLSSRLLEIGSVVRIKNALFNAGAPLLETDHYTIFEKIRLPFSKSHPPPSTTPALVPDTSSSMTTQAHSLIFHNELARMLEVPFSDHERLARLEAETDFAEISAENLAVVRERFRYSLVSLRGKITRQVEERRYNGCAACFHEIQSSPLLDSNDGVNFCPKCSEAQPAVPCIDGTFAVSVGNGVDAMLQLRHDQLCTLLQTLPKPINLTQYLRDIDTKNNNKQNKNNDKSYKHNNNKAKYILSKLLTPYTINSPCKCIDGSTLTCVNVKGASFSLK